MLRNLLLATCVAAIPSAALAQSATQGTMPQNAQRAQMSGKFLAMPAAGQIRAADLRSADIYTADNQKVGDIDDILLDSRGNIVAVVVGVGGFLGIGEKNVAIPFESLDMMAGNNMAANNTTGMNTSGANTTGMNTGGAAMTPNAASRDGMTTGVVPGNNAAATDQDRQRATAQRAEQMSREQAAAQRGTTTGANQRMAQADGPWKPERILLKGVTKAELESAPAFNWDANSMRGNNANTPARNR